MGEEVTSVVEKPDLSNRFPTLGRKGGPNEKRSKIFPRKGPGSTQKIVGKSVTRGSQREKRCGANGDRG